MNLARHSFSGSSRTLSNRTLPPVEQTNINNGTFLGRLLRGSSSRSSNNSEPIRALEQVIDLESNLDLYRYDQIRLLNSRVLYRTGPLNLATSLLQISREEQVQVTTNAVNLDIISK